jgi:hypothetical protein
MTLAQDGRGQIRQRRPRRARRASGRSRNPAPRAHLAACGRGAGRSVTVADLSACGYHCHPEPFGIARADRPHNARRPDRITALPGWRHPYDLMPGNPGDRAP